MDVIVEHQALTRTSAGSVVGAIWLRSTQNPRIDFPDAGWTDFPVVILGLWLSEIEAVLRRASSEAKCTSIDGPFEFRINEAGEIRLLERGLSGTIEVAVFRVDLQEFWQQLSLAASHLVAEFDRRGWSDSDVGNLRRFVED